MKKNTNMKEDLDYIRQKYGSVAEIKQKMDIAEMKEKKIDELVSNLSTSIKSCENQLSCYKCMNLVNEPVVQAPCAHVLCKKCSMSENQCAQCSRTIKDRLGPSEMLQDLVNKFTFCRDAIKTFKNEQFWKSKQESVTAA